MKFSLSKGAVSRLLSLSSKSTVARSNLPILSNVLIKTSGSQVEIVTTSLETAVRVLAKCKVERAGETTVLGRALLEFVGQLEEGEVSFEKIGEELIVESGRLNARFATIAPEEFPVIPKVEGGKVFNLDAKELSESVGRVSFCAAQDESRPILSGVLFDMSKAGMSLVATDGFRLGASEVKGPKEAHGSIKFVLPVRAAVEIPKMVAELVGEDGDGGLTMTVADNLSQAVFKMWGLEFTTRLIEGSYPQWEKLIPSDFSTKVTLQREDLIRAVKVAAIFAKEAGNIIKIRVGQDGKKGSVVVTSNSAQMGSSDAAIDGELVGPGGEIAFNYRYVLEALSSMSGEEILFEMNESLNPGKLSDKSNSAFFHVIMPVRLQS